MARIPVLAGNWKMNLDIEGAKKLATAFLADDIDFSTRKVVLGPSFTNIYPVAEILKGSKIAVAAQNVSTEDSGAFTGDVSASMIKSAGASHVIIGHSERRTVFGETDELINKRTKKALENGLTVILCVGELLEEREAGVAVETVLTQTGKSLAGIASLDDIIIAYEPVWAIGTGKTASPEDAEAMHAAIRELLVRLYGNEAAESTCILYGGSVKPDNVKELMSKKNVDGALVGGASLKHEDFIKIINFDKE